MRLRREYDNRRNLLKADIENSDSVQKEACKKDSRIYVIQKHDATRLHYDFRLEYEGVLKSWAVPKGPSLDPGKKRLAVYVEDHSLEYAGFEGVISEENYGAGKVIIWDRGVYEHTTIHKNEKTSLSINEAIKEGFIEFQLKGEKLEGGWVLVRISRNQPKDWLLIKKRDVFADRNIDILKKHPASVKSGLLIEEIE